MKKLSKDIRVSITPPEGREGERIYYRINPSGHKEQVIKNKGKLDDETLNELALKINNMLEDIEIGSSPSLSAETPEPYRQTPQMVGSKGDSIRNLGDTITNMSGSTPLQGDLDETDGDERANIYNNGIGDKHNPAVLVGGDVEQRPKDFVRMESFTGTAGIAIAPISGVMEPAKKKVKSRKLRIAKPNGTWEHNMNSDIDRLLNEWEPEFVAGEYDPGEHSMDKRGGEGVAGKKAKTAKELGHGGMKNHGEPFGAEHNETPAMCDVEESGVEDKPQGDHESSVGDPLADGCCDEVGHNWPDQPKHTGGGVAEPVKGNRYSDGGVLHGASMEWSPDKIGRLMGEECNLQSIFDSYAKSTKAVHLEGFADLCQAHGLDVTLDETSLLRLMDNNQQYMFYENEDADGIYYTKRAVGGLMREEDGAFDSDIEDDGSELEEFDADLAGSEFTDDEESEPHSVMIDGVKYIPASDSHSVSHEEEDMGPLEAEEGPLPEGMAESEDEMPPFIAKKIIKKKKMEKTKEKPSSRDGGCY